VLGADAATASSIVAASKYAASTDGGLVETKRPHTPAAYEGPADEGPR
jgi:hypothetical protein